MRSAVSRAGRGIKILRFHGSGRTSTSTPCNATNVVENHVIKLQKRQKSTTVSTIVEGRELSLNVGTVGPLADGVVFAKYGNTSLLVSAVSGWEPASSDFLPLQVDFREKAFAGGLIPGTFTRREAAASDRETLAARVIDRSVRPLFPKGFFYDTQLICSIMSYDKDCDPGMLSIVAASAALHVSNIPWNGPCAAVRVGWVDGQPVLAPTYEQDLKSKLNLLYTGIEDKTLMLEIGAFELPEQKIIQALRFAHGQIQPLLQLQNDLKAAVGKDKKDLQLLKAPQEVIDAVKDLIWDDARSMYRQHHYKKAERGNAQRLLFLKIKEKLRDAFPSEMHRYFGQAGDTVMKAALRSVVAEAAEGQPTEYIQPFIGPTVYPNTPHLAQGDALAVERETVGASEAVVSSADGVAGSAVTEEPDFEQVGAPGCRPDGRSTSAIRNISCEVDVLPLVHGSAVFTRGDTQVLCTTTLGPLDLAQMLRPLSGDIQKKQFFLHYDFPPYCTNEVGKVGGSNRRMVGHGALAEKALVPVMPDESEFPFTIRATSEVSGSDGSSSMATVCGACLSLLDAGVPLKALVAGISIGCFTPPADEFTVSGAKKRYHLLTDIFGLEDHAGDMDFKIAGSRFGVTAAQLDVKPAGLPLEVLEQAIWRAKLARLQVLDSMAAVLPRPRSEMKPSAPRIEQMVIPQELVGKLIGPGGSNVKKIMSATGAKVQIDADSPTVSLYATAEQLASARNMIHSALDEHRRMIGSPLSLATSPNAPVLNVGQAVTCKVLKVHDFGVVLGSDAHELGWMHISEFSPKRTSRVTDLMNEGDEVTAMVVDVDVRGRAKFSIRPLLSENESNVSKFIVRKGVQSVVIDAPTTTAAAAPAATINVTPDATTQVSSSSAAVESVSPVSEHEVNQDSVVAVVSALTAPASKMVDMIVEPVSQEVSTQTSAAKPTQSINRLRYALSVSDLVSRIDSLASFVGDDDCQELLSSDVFSYLSGGAQQATANFARLRSEVYARAGVKVDARRDYVEASGVRHGRHNSNQRFHTKVYSKTRHHSSSNAAAKHHTRAEKLAKMK